MKKAIVGIAAIIILAIGAVFIVGQMGDRGSKRGFGGHGSPMFLRKMAKQIGLTDEQKVQAGEILETGRANIEPIITELRENRKTARSFGIDGNFDAEKVEAHAAAQAALMTRLIVEKEKAKAQMFSILNDEQKAKAAELLSKFNEKFGRKRHRAFQGRDQGPVF